MATTQLVLGIDPGQVVMGYVLAAFTGQQREVIAKGSLRDVDADKVVRWLDAICSDRFPHVIGIEGYDWHGPERSANQNAFRISRLVGAIEGAALMWSRRCNDAITRVIVVSKLEANASVGLTGKTPKSRVAKMVEALFPGVKFENEHERDGAVACMGARSRAGRLAVE